MTEAAKYHVLPIDDRTIERTNPELAGRPDVMGARTSLTLYEGMEGMLENTFINVKNRSKKVTAEIVVPEGCESTCDSPWRLQESIPMKCDFLNIINCCACLVAALPQVAIADQAADRAAIEKAIESYAAAFNAGDAEALAAHWSSDADAYVRDRIARPG